MPGGSSQPDTVTQRTEPPAFAKPLINAGVKEAERLFGQAPQQYYPGRTVVGFAPQTEAGLNILENFTFSPTTQTALRRISSAAFNGSPSVTAAQEALTKTLRGDYVNSNPYIDDVAADTRRVVTENFTKNLLPTIQSAFAKGGRLGSVGYDQAIQDAVSGVTRDIAANENALRGNALEAERGRMTQALSLAPSISSLDLQRLTAALGAGQQQDTMNRTRAQDLINVGQAREGLEGQRIDDSVQRFNFAQNAEQQRLTQLMANLNSLMGNFQSSTATNPLPQQNQFLSAIGGAASGLGLAGSLGAIPGLSAVGGPVGLGIGAGVGLLGGLFG